VILDPTRLRRNDGTVSLACPMARGI
jgi:hypothetical protein